MKKKLGVYICACGGNISDYVDIERVKEAIADDDCVYLAKTTMFACGDSNQKEMEADIISNNLSGIVVASCSPKLHLSTFRGVSERAGLNRYNYVHANIREQASWAHSDDKAGATEKAISLVKAAIAKARFAQSLDPITIKSKRAVAVIGAGISGMKAAISLAQMNDKVFLIEREDHVGGNIASIDVVAPHKVSGKILIERLKEEIDNNEAIEVFTNSQVVESSGSIGDFKLTIIENGSSSSKNNDSKELNVGSVLISTGFNSYKPLDGESGYNVIPNVVTLPQFKEILSKSNLKKLTVNGNDINSIAYIYCVGSRQINGDNKYCSRYCCTAAIQTALDVKRKFGHIQNYHFTRGVRTYGSQELLYNESNRQGDIFIQYPDKEQPIVEQHKNSIVIKAKDILSGKREWEADVDLVVLVTGMVPDKDNSIGTLFKLPKGRDHFFNEIHVKLRPVETVIDGVTIAGTCQGPKNVMESVNSALSAAAKSHSFVSKGELELEPIIAYVDKESCKWCGACVDACPFNAIARVEENGKAIASISKSSCKGCGMCLPVCPEDALELATFSNKEIESMIDILAK